jgi:peptide/nickel transport system permease protein
MVSYFARRLVHGVVVLVLVMMFVFLLLHALPGNAVTLQLQDSSGVSAEQAKRQLDAFGLNDPVWVQFWDWLTNALHGDFGKSFMDDEPVLNKFLRAVPITLLLALWGTIIGTIGGVTLGVLAAMRRGRVVDGSVRLFAVTGLSIPGFVIALLVLLVLSQRFGWSPPLVYTAPWQNLNNYVQQVVIPVLALSVAAVAGLTRLTRSALLEVMGSNYIAAVRARGASASTVMFKHALRNAAIPLFTVLALHLGEILGGSVIFETMFSLPGTGQLVYNAVLHRDYPVVLICALFYALLFIAMVIFIDFMYAVIDPRIRAGRSVSE